MPPPVQEVVGCKNMYFGIVKSRKKLWSARVVSGGKRVPFGARQDARTAI